MHILLLIAGEAMFVRSRVIQALEAKKGHFSQYQGGVSERAAGLDETLMHIASLSRAEVEARLAATGVARPGALPTDEHDQMHTVVVHFGARWNTHEEARAWAKRVLLGQPTFAVDGSQIPQSHDFSIPVAAIQIGWFENPHAPFRPYVKDVFFEVLTPDELAAYEEATDASDQTLGSSAFPGILVNLRRFQGECQRIIAYMQEHAAHEPKPLCFFDGSLTLSFARHLSPQLRQEYLRSLVTMLRTSQSTRVPVIGYVDSSYARDLVTMLTLFSGTSTPAHLNDGILLQPYMRWGDRSLVYWCARDDEILPLYETEVGRIAFVYLKTSTTALPARIEFPGWLLEDWARMERILDLIRAECVVGNGYPYVLETADAVAVISAEDRQRFYAVFQQFAEREGLTLRYSRKARSKAIRR
ncbi:MAG: DNA double-strand break repair nuclease NurA [Anaerolineae bacterium]|nr:DNA double-strand break repair nuclease NurA [Anaerolineae bacterium]MDW8069913.1 DNA double-strand break repair nuclease NurA [Anaerolineae bacterium]